MKKTSKKLLSLFLAVVMAVTSCSVGFAAFAEEKTPETYWNNTTKSDEAFSAINDLIDTYVPTILNIVTEYEKDENEKEILDKDGNKIPKTHLYDLLGMDKASASSATLTNVVEAASPMLMSLLGKTDVNVKEFLTSHSSVTGINETNWKNKYLKYYSYLDGTKEDTMSFYSLYTFCESNKNNSNTDIANYCKETLDKLNTLLQICSAAESSYSTKVSNADAAYNNLRNKVTTASIKNDIKVSEVGEIEYNGTKIKELSGEAYDDGIKFCNDALAAAGVSFKATNPAEALMYYYVIPTGYAYTLNGANANSKGISYATALLYAKLAKDGGKEIAGVTIPTEANDQPTLFAKEVYSKLADTNGTASIASNRNYDTFTSSSFEAINKSILLATGEYEDMAAVTKAVENAKISDAQLEELKAHAVDGQYSTLYDYINSTDCTLSSYAKTMLNAIYSAQTNRSDFSMLNNEIATSVAAAKAYKSTITNYKTWGQMRNGGAEMPVILLINDIISGVMTKNDIASGTNIASANIVSKPFFDFLEANKLNSAIKPETSKVEYSYKAYAIPPQFTVEAVNSLLNETVGGILDPATDVGAMVTPIINGFLETEITLYNSEGTGIVNDIWKKLYNEPVQTVFNLLPVLAILVDEVVAPMLLTEGDGKLDGLIDDPTTLLGQFALKSNNTKIGLTSLHFDLNKVLPATLAWLNGDEETAKKLVKTYGEFVEEKGITVEPSKWVDKDGKAPTKKEDMQPELNKDVYMFTGVYVADNLIYGLKNLTKLTDTLYDSFTKEKIEKNTLTENDAKSYKALATGITEAVKEIANFANIAVKDYLANDTYANEQRYGIDYTSPTQRTQKGLNNVFVALPRLVDSIGKQFIKKYKINSDWTTLYANKYTTKDKTFTDGTVTQTYNATLEDFKALVKGNDSAAVLDSLVNIVAGSWINPLLDIVNDTISTNNALTNRIPLVQGLLNSLGGFGEKSIITDVLNGFFSLTREDKTSFSFVEDSKTGYVGLTKDSGIFLMANLKGIVDLIFNIINEKNTYEEAEKAKQAGTKLSMAASLLASSATSAAGTDYSKLLTDKNVKAADELITKLDNILKSLLANTSLNEFTLTSNENILAGVFSTLANYIGESNTNALINLLDEYTKILVVAPENGNADPKKMFTNDQLSTLVTKTYVLIEDVIGYVLYGSGSKNATILGKADKGQAILGVVKGLISPDSLSVRISDDYKSVAKSLSGIKSWKNVKSVNFGVSAGDKEGFYNALGESLSTISIVVSSILTSAYTSADRTENIYSAVLNPVLSKIAKSVGAKEVMSVTEFNKSTPQKQLVSGVIVPLSNILSKIYDAPATFILNFASGLAEIAEDKNFVPVLNSVVNIANFNVNSLLSVISDADALNAPTLAAFVADKLNDTKAFKGDGVTATRTYLNVAVNEKDTLVSLINTLLDGKFVLPSIDWSKFAKATSGEKLLLIYGYVVDTVLGSDLIAGALENAAPEIVALVKNLSATDVLTIVTEILKMTQSPIEAYWTFKEYASSLTGKFYYPQGITASDAEEAVANIDTLVQNVFPLLNSLGVTDIESLQALVNDKLYTNEILTTIATAAYGAIEGLLDENGLTDTLASLGIDLSTQGIADYLMDTDYGKTYSSAAKTLSSATSWKKVKKLNWGFKNGTKAAQAGFINGLAAILRPLNDVLAIFLVEGKDLNINILNDDNKVALISLLKGLHVDPMELKDFTTVKEDGDTEFGCKLTLQIKAGILTLTVDSKISNDNSVLKVDLAKIVEEVLNIIGDVNIGIGTNGYENAIIPILEAFICKDVKTYAQYQKDYAKAKDNLLIDILKPVLGLVNDITAKPAETLTSILPNVAYFIDSNGLAQAVGNLLAPVTAKGGVIDILDKNGVNVNKLIKGIAGKDLGKIITDAIGIKTKLTFDLTDMSTCNIQDILVPTINKLLKSKLGMTLPNFTFAQIASHGKIKVVKSAARNDKGKFTTRRVIANKGEVLVAVLRYVADTIIKNATPIKKLLLNIDAIKKNKTIKSILNSIFGTLRTAGKDDLVRVVFYLISDNGYQDSFFDYTEFITKDYDFSFGDMDEDFCRKLAPMLDGLVGGLLGDKGGLLGLIGGIAYKDEIVATIATALYGAIEGVKIDKVGSLTNILTAADIDFTTGNVAALLTDEKYGKKFESAAATIKKAGKWANVKKESLSFGVKDRETFIDALCAVLRPIYGVLDVLLNDGKLELLQAISIKGSDGYTSFLVPLMEAFGIYNIKTQYQYREDMCKEYDAILKDVLNPLMDKVEDILNAPIEMLMDILPNLSLFFANNGLLQLIDNLLTPVSAILDALKPIVNVNDILKAVNLDINGLLKKIGISANVTVDVYDLKATLLPVIGSESVVSLLNGILGIIKIGGKPLGLVLPEIDWYQLASHGEYVNATSQVACLGTRISVQADQDETLIAVLRYLINTINYKDNYNTIVNLITGLLGDGVSDSIAGVIDQVLGMVKGDADTVIKELVDLLQSIAG